MKLQLALDAVDWEEAERILSAASPYIDIVEIGTPLALREGVRAIREAKRKYGGLEVLADFKIVDGGKLEAGMAFEAGADIVTVLAFACDVTVEAAVEEARRAGKRVMADMLGVRDVPDRAKELTELGVDYICLHTASDLQAGRHQPLRQLREMRGMIEPHHLAVAGGISLDMMKDVIPERPAIVVVGQSIAAAPDPARAARAMKAAMKGGTAT